MELIFVLLSGVLSSAVGLSTEKLNLEETVIYLNQKMTEMEKMKDELLEMKRIQAIHSSQIDGLTKQLSDIQNSCAGEPPSVRNAKPLHFDRKHESVVRYECNPDFILIGNSTVRCKSGRWEGQPPICSFFDATFTLMAHKPLNITCYSDRHFRTIEFSRVLDTGMGGGLPSVATSTPGEKAADLRFNYIRPHDAKYGVYECRLAAHNRTEAIVVPVQDFDDLQFPEPTKVVSIGDTVDLQIITYRERSRLIWRHNGVVVPSWINRRGVAIRNVQLEDAGIYECHAEGKRGQLPVAFMRLIVKKCGMDLYGEACDQKCPVCYNGGICHELLGICICPPGFTGNDCEVACGENRFGVDCSQKCPRSDCMNFLFCKPDPYGCSCAPGIQGYRCLAPCSPGWYGADCKQPCHCASGPEHCNRQTGACSGGCSPGWTGQSCQIQVVS